MKFTSKIFSSIILFFVFLFPVYASGDPTETDSLFYEWNIESLWYVQGHKGGEHAARLGKKLKPSCVSLQKYDDGSDFQVIQDLEDGELYISAGSPFWQFDNNDKDDHYINLNFYHSNGKFDSYIRTKFKIINKNVIYIPNLDVESFIQKFSDNQTLNIVPNQYQYESLRVNLKDSRYAVGSMLECMKKYVNKSENLRQ